VVEGGVDLLTVSLDAAGQFDEPWDGAAPRPADPPVKGLFDFLAFDRKNVPQAFLSR
jgi:hypothetical protein